MKTDYNEAARTYDNTRNISDELIDMFENKVHFHASMNILDFGCGTGNYLFSIFHKYRPNCFGVEPSDGMREKALQKNPGITIVNGDHAHIPFEDGFFDFIYMTDVIHHIPDLNRLFCTLNKKLKKNGTICILTESHEQIETRWFNRYFKSLIQIEKSRYPDISEIVNSAKTNGLTLIENQIRYYKGNYIIDSVFIKTVEEKNYSMFRLLDNTEYNEGLAKIKTDKGKTVESMNHGETLVWLQKL